MTVFFDTQGIILCEFLPQREKIDAARYIKTLAALKQKIRQKHPQLWKDRNFWIHHDNASVHTCGDTATKIQEWGLKVLQHPPYSPDIALCDFALFPKLKSMLKGCRFRNLKQLQDTARDILINKMPKDTFSDAMHDLVARWQKCVAVSGNYFEGDHVDIDPLFEKGPPATSGDSDSD